MKPKPKSNLRKIRTPFGSSQDVDERVSKKWKLSADDYRSFLLYLGKCLPVSKFTNAHCGYCKKRKVGVAFCPDCTAAYCSKSCCQKDKPRHKSLPTTCSFDYELKFSCVEYGLRVFEGIITQQMKEDVELLEAKFIHRYRQNFQKAMKNFICVGKYKKSAEVFIRKLVAEKGNMERMVIRKKLDSYVPNFFFMYKHEIMDLTMTHLKLFKDAVRKAVDEKKKMSDRIARELIEEEEGSMGKHGGRKKKNQKKKKNVKKKNVINTGDTTRSDEKLSFNIPMKVLKKKIGELADPYNVVVGRANNTNDPMVGKVSTTDNIEVNKYVRTMKDLTFRKSKELHSDIKKNIRIKLQKQKLINDGLGNTAPTTPPPPRDHDEFEGESENEFLFGKAFHEIDFGLNVSSDVVESVLNERDMKILGGLDSVKKMIKDEFNELRKSFNEKLEGIEKRLGVLEGKLLQKEYIK